MGKMVECIIGICGARVIDASRHAENEVMYDCSLPSWLYVYVCMIVKAWFSRSFIHWYITIFLNVLDYLHGIGSAKEQDEANETYDKRVWGHVFWVVY